MDETTYKIALSGLLHDIGKFMQRAELEKEFSEIKDNYGGFCRVDVGGRPSYLHAAHTAYFIEKLVPENIINNIDKSELYNGARHHKNPAGDVYREADILSAGMERYDDERDPSGYKKVRLHSIFDAVELQFAIRDKANHLNGRWRYGLTDLSSNNPNLLYPAMGDEADNVASKSTSYKNLWDKFRKELEEINRSSNIEAYFHRLYWLIEKYTWCIPSATNVYSDISLFDHLKTTAAICSCYYLRGRESENETQEFMLYAGDISGIQDYIFKISQAQGVGGISKRLRGRSFYIAMLGEIFSRYVINSVGLTAANVNYCGGGNFEILLPNTQYVSSFLDNLVSKINEWFLEKFHGSLSYVDARLKMASGDLRNRYGEKKDELFEKLQLAKLNKNRSQLDDEVFWVDQKEIEGRISICPSCNLKLIDDNETICELCQEDKDIGQLLPWAGYLVFSQSGIQSEESNKTLKFGKFGCVTLVNKNADPLKLSQTAQAVYSFSEEDSEGMARYFFAQTLPVALTEMDLETEKDEIGNTMVRKGQTLSFSTLADMADGDKRIGILKMDVDNLGLAFSLGLDSPPTAQDKAINLRSISRLSNLSRQLSFFFAIHIDQLCGEVFDDWRHDDKNKWPHKMKVSSVFYLVFAGGDDLFIIGPWDKIIDLARRIRKAFKDFTCHNPNITISAGIYICKPKFPISMAARKAEDALKRSKDKGKNRITVMEETVIWDKEDARSRIYQNELRSRYPAKVFEQNEICGEHIYMVGEVKKRRIGTSTFEDLHQFAGKLQEYYEKKLIFRRFLYRLLSAKEEFFLSIFNDAKMHFEETHNLMILPHLLYNIERNADDRVKNELKGILVVSPGEAQEYLRQAYYPCKYVLMKTRQ